MNVFRFRYLAVVAAMVVASGCALWFGKAPTLTPDAYLSSDTHMEQAGFRIVPDAADPSRPAAFNRIRRVYTKGSGPRVILLHELPGLRKGDIEVGRALSERFEVYVPLLFGTAGQEDKGLGTRQACRSGLFNCNDRNTRHSVTEDLLAMASRLCGTSDCGVIGMCLTGTIPLWLLDADGVVAIVLAQPTLPLVLHLWPFAGIDISEQDTSKAMAKAVERKAAIYMLRYRGDWISGRSAFHRLVKRIAPFKDKLSFFEVDEVLGGGHSTLVHDPKHPHVSSAQIKRVMDAMSTRLRSAGGQPQP